MKSFVRRWLFKNIANGITILGLIFSIWLILEAVTSPRQLWLITTLAISIGLTDFFDGMTARRLKIKSVFGAALDRLRDKIFVCSVLIILLYYYHDDTFESLASFNFTAVLVALVIAIECLLLSGWFWGLVKKWNIESGKYGKIKMALQFGVIVIWMGSITSKQYLGLGLIGSLIYLINLLLIAAIFFGAKSLEGYWKRYTNES